MDWKGKELITIGDLMRHGIDTCETPEEAQRFMELYRAENQHADRNIGYLSGYYDVEDMKRIQQWFCVKHPIFGGTVPSPTEAIGAGAQEVKGGTPDALDK